VSEGEGGFRAQRNWEKHAAPAACVLCSLRRSAGAGGGIWSCERARRLGRSRTRYTIRSLKMNDGRSGGDCVEASPWRLGMTCARRGSGSSADAVGRALGAEGVFSSSPWASRVATHRVDLDGLSRGGARGGDLGARRGAREARGGRHAALRAQTADRGRPRRGGLRRGVEGWDRRGVRRSRGAMDAALDVDKGRLPALAARGRARSAPRSGRGRTMVDRDIPRASVRGDVRRAALIGGAPRAPTPVAGFTTSSETPRASIARALNRSEVPEFPPVGWFVDSHRSIGQLLLPT